MCPNLKACEDELYKELPEDVRRVIEHPEDLQDPTDGSGVGLG